MPEPRTEHPLTVLSRVLDKPWLERHKVSTNLHFGKWIFLSVWKLDCN
ncbi:MAG: hypothetical protein WCQ52_08470 [Actinomycetes bacterium]